MTNINRKRLFNYNLLLLIMQLLHENSSYNQAWRYIPLILAEGGRSESAWSTQGPLGYPRLYTKTLSQ